MKNPVAASGIEPATFPLVVKYLNQLRSQLNLYSKKNYQDS
jgi:hypothetical protein